MGGFFIEEVLDKYSNPCRVTPMKRDILKLNKGYSPVGIGNYKSVVTDIFSGAVHPIRVARDEEGKLSEFSRVSSLSEWLSFEPREGEEFINTPHGQFVLPVVVICTSDYVDPQGKSIIFPSKKNIWKRDKNICQYTGVLLTKDQLSIDHVLPVSRGGKNTWDNMVTCDRLLNSRKGSCTPEEFDLKLIRPAVKPKNGLVCNEYYTQWESLF